MSRIWLVVAMLVGICPWSLPIFGQVELNVVLDGFDAPVAVTHAGDSRLFVTERVGRIQIVENGVRRAQPFFDIRTRVVSGGERGLLSVAFHPDYADNRLFFVNYTNLAGDTVVSRFQTSPIDPDRADTSSEKVLLVIDQPFSNHNGGQLQFGPDGMLYVGMGDGGSADDPQCVAQKSDSLLGKLLRLDVDQNRDTPPYYGIPANNPFVSSQAMPEEVLATGLRNPWRFSFDRQTGDLYLGDVGQGRREEIDRIDVQVLTAASSSATNFGWKVMEGTLCNTSQNCLGSTPACGAPELTLPILEYSHTLGCSVTGGYVYRGRGVPELFGRYLYGDFCSGTVWSARRVGATWTSEELPFEVSDLSSFGEDVAGELYLLSQGGTLYRVGDGVSGNAGSVQFREGLYEVGEGDGLVRVSVERTGGSAGDVSVLLRSFDRTAEAGEDYAAASFDVFFASGESGVKRAEIEIVDDLEIESAERFVVELSSPTAGLTLGARSSAQVEIADNDVAVEPCEPSATVLCLNQGRFRVETSWQDFEGGVGVGMSVPLTEDSGFFWFFADSNVELVVKVLDGCLLFDHYWVFAAGLTNVQVTMTVTDTETGVKKVYDNSLGQSFVPIQDISAFATCP